MSVRSITAKELKDLISPIDFYTRELTYIGNRKTGGWANGGLCPFHDDRRAGSFWVNTRSGGFKCFSCNTKGGDIIAFIQARYGLTFWEALQRLKDDWRWK
jgi:DNA primase